MDKQPTVIPSDILEKCNEPVGPAEFAKNVGKIMSVPADENPDMGQFLKNPKDRPRKGADDGQQAIG